MGLVVNVREHKTGEAPFMRSTSCSFHCSRVKAVQNMTDLLELSRQWIKSWGSCCLIKNSTAAIEHASLRNWFCAASLIGPNSFVISAKPWDQVGGSKKNNPVQQKRCLSIEMETTTPSVTWQQKHESQAKERRDGTVPFLIHQKVARYTLDTNLLKLSHQIAWKTFEGCSKFVHVEKDIFRHFRKETLDETDNCIPRDLRNECNDPVKS